MAKKIDEIYAEFILKMDKKGFTFLDKKLDSIDKKVTRIESKIMKSKVGKKIKIMTDRLKELGRVNLNNLDKLSKVNMRSMRVPKSQGASNLPMVVPQVRNLPAIPEVQAINKIQKVNNQYKVLSKNMDNVAKKGQKLSLGFDGKVTNLNRINGSFKKIDSTIKNLTRDFKNFSDKVQGAKKNLLSLGVGAGIGLAVLTSGVSSSLNEFSTFQGEMLRVKAISGATAEEYKVLSDEAKRLGKETRFTNLEIAQSQKFYAMAGNSVEQINAALEPTINLATATGEELSTLADIVSDSTSAFNLASSETGKFVDILAATATSTNTNVRMMGEAFKYVAPVASEMGLEVEQTAKILGIMANNGIKASMAGTTLRQSLVRLNEVPVDQLEKLGLNFKEFDKLDTQGKIDALSKSFKGLEGTQRVATAKAIFGQTAFTGMLKVLLSTEGATKKLDDALKNYSGTAKEMADTTNSGLEGSFLELNSAVSGLRTEIGEQLTPVFQPLVDVMTGTINVVTNFIKTTDAAIPIITILAGALIGALIPALYLSATALWALVAPALVIAAPFIAWGVAIGAVVGVIVWAYKKFETFRNIIDLLGESIKFLLSLTLTSTWLKGFEKIKSFFGGDNNIEMNGEKNLDVISNNTAEGTSQDRRQREANNSTNNYNRSNSTSITNNNTIINNVRDNKSLEDRQREDLSYNNRRFSY